ncbi:MAG: MarR family transcriptional regulator [Candidatus Heimdallarchaeota archaeon]|nr:MarR family transcriptional regulator [Candidatus Heimdallarchaeota archaeon]MCK4770764.1 MarR family transcriptional regulator [Candidatus Heimdallarchaeota archaeon]
MNIDQGYQDMPFYDKSQSTIPKLDELPYDYFYNTDYNYLTIPEVQLLLILSDSQVSYTFSGLRKTTSLHQHQLTKALKRLQDRELLLKKDNGTYEITDLGSKRTRELLRDLIKNRAINTQENLSYSNWKRMKIIPPIDQDIIVSYLERRWFGKFRYLYRKNLENSIELCWEDGRKNQVHLFIGAFGDVDIEYRTKHPSYSEMTYISNWIKNEIVNQNDVLTKIEEIDEEINQNSYN